MQNGQDVDARRPRYIENEVRKARYDGTTNLPVNDGMRLREILDIRKRFFDRCKEALAEAAAQRFIPLEG